MKEELTKQEISEGYVWKCGQCGDLSTVEEIFCENCFGDDV